MTGIGPRKTAGMIAAVLAVALLMPSAPAGAAFPGSNGKIAFQSDRVTLLNPQGDNEIFTMNPDGTGVQQITSNDDSDVDPEWSANGERNAFMSDRAGDHAIFTMTPDGTDHDQVTDGDIPDSAPTFSPAWSPNAKRLALVRITGANNYDIYTIKAAGGDPIRLTNGSAADRNPDWQPR